MARSRNIKPGIFKNELLGVADPMLTILFQSLWCLADKAGRLEDRPLRIKAETFPYREGLDVNGYLTELERMGFIQRYSVGELALIQVVNFDKHQNPHKTEKESELPDYSMKTGGCAITVKEPLKHGTSRADSLIPDSLNTDSGFLKSDSPIPEVVATPSAASKKTAKVLDPAKQQACKATWDSYADAYFNRYGAEPVRNAKVNGQIVNIVERLGYEESPPVAAFFVWHNNSFYVRDMHSVGILQKDCEKLRTEWATNSRMTQTKAIQADKTASNLDSFAPLIAAAKAREEQERKNNGQ